MSQRSSSSSSSASSTDSTSSSSSSSSSSSESDSSSSPDNDTKQLHSNNDKGSIKPIDFSSGGVSDDNKDIPIRLVADNKPVNLSRLSESHQSQANQTNKPKSNAISKPDQAKQTHYSFPNTSDDDNDVTSKLQSKPTTPRDNTKRKKAPSTKKYNTSVLNHPSKSVPISTGGKAPPAVVKKQQQQLHCLAMSKSTNVKVPKIRHSSNPASSTILRTVKSESKLLNHISSFEDSSKDDEQLPFKRSCSGIQIKGKDGSKKINLTRKSKSKSSEESSSSSSSSDDASSEASIVPLLQSSKAPKRDPSTPSHSLTHSKSKIDISDRNASATSSSEQNKTNSAPNASTRKLTRSIARNKYKSKHLMYASDTDSADDAVSKCTVAKSPAKRNMQNKSKSNSKLTNDLKYDCSENIKRSLEAKLPDEKLCPLAGCNSSGHLSGNHDKHFTLEACPIWHGLGEPHFTNNFKKRAEDRNRARILYDPDNKQLTVEQHAYQLKIRDMRSKFEPSQALATTILPAVSSSTGNVCRPARPGSLMYRGGDIRSEEYNREPNLNGIVPEYDLQLFREAQSIASERIEDELRDLPIGNGTKFIIMGRHKMEVWYQSPYPDDVTRLPKLYLCEFCLRYQKSEIGMKRHSAKCVWRHPPGDEIYRKLKLCVWQVDGKRHKPYCQNLCLLAKFFLDHKTLYYDVEPFLFYVMTIADSDGCHIVGYFSKEKNSFLNYNVSCILTLPPYQRKGYGRILIDFSYLLTRVEGKIGSPEKPLSDLGLISYRSYWKDVLLNYLCSRTGTTLSIKDVSQEMAINSYDIVSTLQALGMMKYWKGKHIILKKQDVLEDYEDRINSRGSVLKIDPACLRWTPFVLPAVPGPS